jgi:hypothetical protein
LSMQKSIEEKLRGEGRRFCIKSIPDQTLYYAFLRDLFDLDWLCADEWFGWLSGYSHYKELDCRSLFWEAELATVPLTGHCAGYNYAKDKIIFSVPHVKAIQDNGLWEHLLLSTIHELTHLADYHSPMKAQALADTAKAEASRQEAFMSDNLTGLLFNHDYHYDCSEVNAKGSQLAYIYFANGGNLDAAMDYEYRELRIQDENDYGKELMLETNTKIQNWLRFIGRQIESSLRDPTLGIG